MRLHAQNVTAAAAAVVRYEFSDVTSSSESTTWEAYAQLPQQ
jgi:hypothetical protein